MTITQLTQGVEQAVRVALLNLIPEGGDPAVFAVSGPHQVVEGDIDRALWTTHLPDVDVAIWRPAVLPEWGVYSFRIAPLADYEDVARRVQDALVDLAVLKAGRESARSSR